MSQQLLRERAEAQRWAIWNRAIAAVPPVERDALLERGDLDPDRPPPGWHKRRDGRWIPDWLRGIRLSDLWYARVARGVHPVSANPMHEDPERTCGSCTRRHRRGWGKPLLCDSQMGRGAEPRQDWPACRSHRSQDERHAEYERRQARLDSLAPVIEVQADDITDGA